MNEFLRGFLFVGGGIAAYAVYLFLVTLADTFVSDRRSRRDREEELR